VQAGPVRVEVQAGLVVAGPVQVEEAVVQAQGEEAEGSQLALRQMSHFRLRTRQRLPGSATYSFRHLRIAD
jgi:hypothetical protein